MSLIVHAKCLQLVCASRNVEFAVDGYFRSNLASVLTNDFEIILFIYLFTFDKLINLPHLQYSSAADIFG